MFRRIFHESSSNNSKKGQKCQNSLRLKRTKRRKTQKQIPNAKHRPPHRCSSKLRLRTKHRTRNILFLYFIYKTDLKYAFSQVPLDPQLQKHCNCNILGGKATGAYRFLNGFSGLTDKPATFQKTMDVTLRNCHNKIAFLDDILVITKTGIVDHEKELDKILYLLDKENLAMKLQKCKVAKKQITWLGYQITPTGITPTKKM